MRISGLGTKQPDEFEAIVLWHVQIGHESGDIIVFVSQRRERRTPDFAIPAS